MINNIIPTKLTILVQKHKILLALKHLVVFYNWFQSKSIRKKLKTKWFKNIQLNGKYLLNIEMSYTSFKNTKIFLTKFY